MLKFENVFKSYLVRGAQVTALHPCNLSVRAGEIFGVVGHSGAGKSTLLRLINRLEEPSGGILSVEGQDVMSLDRAGLTALRRRIGMIFQHFNLLSARTVAENVAFPLQLAGVSQSQAFQRVQMLLERVGLNGYSKYYPRQLSGGQKQRVGIARALATSPSILLCDEATSALDPHTTQSVLRLLDEINQEMGLTIVLITHEMGVIRKICDRVAVLESGHIVEQGLVRDIFLHPKHPSTSRIISKETSFIVPNALQAVPRPARCVRLTMIGSQTRQPFISHLLRDYGVECSIFYGQVDLIKHTPYAQLHALLQGGNQSDAVAALERAGISVEVFKEEI